MLIAPCLQVAFWYKMLFLMATHLLDELLTSD